MLQCVSILLSLSVSLCVFLCGQVDPRKRAVSWLGWNFYLSYSRQNGLTFFDIKYKDKR